MLRCSGPPLAAEARVTGHDGAPIRRRCRRLAASHITWLSQLQGVLPVASQSAAIAGQAAPRGSPTGDAGGDSSAVVEHSCTQPRSPPSVKVKAAPIPSAGRAGGAPAARPSLGTHLPWPRLSHVRDWEAPLVAPPPRMNLL